MADLIRWGRPSRVSLQRDIEDLLEDFLSPRAFRREMDRLFDEVSAPRALWQEMDRLMDEFESPPTLRRRVARLFEDFVSAVKRPFSREKATFIPSIDVTERDSEYVIKADLPGMREQDIDLRIDDDNVLTLTGERREEETKRLHGYECSERSYGTFSRSVALSSGIDASKIEADFRNGVLEVRIPKTEASRARKIPIAREEPRVIAQSNGPAAQTPPTQGRVT